MTTLILYYLINFVFLISEYTSRGLPHPEVVWSRLDAKQQELANQESVVNFSANRKLVQPANQNMTISSAYSMEDSPENHVTSSQNHLVTETA
jgi:hypothetical protein